MDKAKQIHKINTEMHIGGIDLSQDKISQYKFIMYLGDNVIIDKDTNTEVENTNGKFLFIPFDIEDDGSKDIDHIDYIFAMKEKFDIRRPEKEHKKSYDELVKDKNPSYVYEFYDALLDMGISFTYNVHTPNEIIEEEERSINFFRSKVYMISDEAKNRLQKLFEQEKYNIYVRVCINDFLSQIQALNEENRDDFVIDVEISCVWFSHRAKGFSGSEFTDFMDELNTLKPTKNTQVNIADILESNGLEPDEW